MAQIHENINSLIYLQTIPNSTPPIIISSPTALLYLDGKRC